MKIAKRLLSIILAMTMAFSVFSIAVIAEEYVGTTTMELVLEKDGVRLEDGDTLAPGDVFDVTLRLFSDYDCGSMSCVFHYDSNYFQTAKNGQPFTQENLKGTESVAEEDEYDQDQKAYYKLLDKEVTTAYQYKETLFSIGGHVNNEPAHFGSSMYYPLEWVELEEGNLFPTLRPEYQHIEFLSIIGIYAVSAPAGGAAITIDPAEDIITFSLMVKEDAPETQVGESARFWINEGCLKTTTNPNGKIYMSKVVGNDSSSVGLDYQFVNSDYNFNISTQSVEEYTVDFDLNGGTGTTPDSVTGEEGIDVTLPPVGDISKEGYTFLGWAETNDATTALTSYTMPNGGATLYAVYSVNSYEINYYLDGVAYDTQTYDYGAPVSAIADPSQAGYVFDGWYEDAQGAGSQYVFGTMPANNIDLYGFMDAQSGIAYKVEHYCEKLDGTFELVDTDNLTGTTGEQVAATENTYTGFTFDANQSTMTGTVSAQGDLVLQAYYNRNSYNIDYMVDEGVYQTISYKYGADVSANLPTEPTKQGHTFTGWDGLPTTMPAENIEVTAQFTVNTYKVTYYSDGDLYQIDTYQFDTAVTPPETDPEKEGYTFTGWSGLPTTMPMDDVDVYAQFEINQYTITFKADGSDDIVITQDYGTEITAPAVPEKAGYTGVWDTVVPTTMPATNMTINAVYTAGNVNYSILHYCEDLTGGFELVDTDNLTGTTGDEATATANTYDGFTFDANQSTMTGTILGDSSLELEAYYTRNEYTFVYMDGETQLDTATFKYGQQFALPIDPEKEGYIFIGWQSDGAPFDAPATVPAYSESTITLTANFVEEGAVGDYSGVEAALELLPNDINKKFYTVEAEGWIDAAYDYPKDLYDQTAIDAIEQDILDLVDELKSFEPKEYYVPVTDSYKTVNAYKHRDESRAEIKYTLTPDKTGALQPGDEVTIVLSVQSNFVLSSGANMFIFDSNYFEPAVSVNYGVEKVKCDLVEDSPFDFCGYKRGIINMDFPREYYPEGPLVNYREDDEYCNRYRAAFVPFLSDPDGIGYVPTEDSQLLYLTLKVKDTAPNGVAEVKLDEGWIRTATHNNDFYVVRGTGTATVDALTAYDAMAIYGQTFDLTDAALSFTIGVEEYSVDFDLNGGTGTTPASVTGEEGIDVTLPSAGDIAKEGYTFLGWAETNDATEVLTSYTMPNGGATLYAIYAINQYTITFKVDGSDDIVITQDYGTAVTAPADPEKTGYTFTGWNPDVPATMPAENLEVTAQFEINQYTITFKADGYDDVVITQDYGTTVTAPADPEKTGYTFTGWDIVVPATMPAENLEVTAQFEINQYTITFKVDGSDDIVITQDYGTTVTAPADPEKEGYTFTGWDTVVPATMPAENLEVTAQFEVNQYTITFKAEGYDDVVITQDYGTAVTAPAIPEKEGYTGEWDTEVPTTMPAADMTINAVYSVIKYKVTYLVDGSEYRVDEYEFDATVIAPADPEKEGYTFTGWSGLPATMPANDIEVTAQFEVNQYTITFKAEGYDDVVITQDYGTTVTAPADPEKTGYTFTGWSPDVPATMPAENVEVTAQFEVNQYTITFKADGSDDIVITQDYGTTVTAPADPEKEGYTFTGWDTVVPATMPAENLEVTAQFEVNQYTITFKADGSDDIVITQDYGTTVTAPADPEKTGYTFTGWNPDVPATMPAENLEVTAQFEVNQYTITFKADGSDDIVITQDYGTTVTAPADPEKEGYTFTGWNPEVPATMPAENVEVTAQFEVNQYTITFKADGSDDIVITQDYGTAVTAPAVPEKEGYTGEWDTVVPTTMPATDMTINAVYTAIGVKYTVDYYCETFIDGEFEIETSEEKTANTGQSVTAEIKTFTGFSYDSDLSTIDGTVTGDGNLVLSVYYTRNSYTITYNVDESEYQIDTYKYGEAVTALTVPEKEGFTGAWDTEVPASMPAYDMEINAVYTEIPVNSHNAIFMVDGDVYATVPTEEGEQIVAPQAPVKEGFRFAGWNPEVGVMGTEDITFTAVFEEINVMNGEFASTEMADLLGTVENGNYYGGVENLYVKVKGHPQKIQIVCMDGSNNTYTYDRVINSQVSITSFDEEGFEIWVIPVALVEGDYTIRAKYDGVFEPIEEGRTMTVEIQTLLEVYLFTMDAEEYENNSTATFTVITSRDVSKIQFVDDATLDTLTYSINYANYQDIVHPEFGDVRLWTVERTVYGPGNTYQYNLRVKIDIKRMWNEDGGSVVFTVTE